MFTQPCSFCIQFYHNSKLQIIVENRIAKQLHMCTVLHDLCCTLYVNNTPNLKPDVTHEKHLKKLQNFDQVRLAA